MSGNAVDYSHFADRDLNFDVSVLGLGAMGAAMARALVAGGKRVAVWNRSASKARSLVDSGAYCCATAEEAFLASPVSIIALLDNDAVHHVLDTVDRSRAFRDRNFVNFTTCSKQESEAFELLITASGGQPVKGAIVAYPRNIGHPESHAIYTGDSDAIASCSNVLEIIAPNLVVLPQEEAYALFAILHVYAFAAMTSFYEAIGASGHFGIPSTQMAHLVSDASRFFVADAIRDATRRLETEDFAGDQARLDVHAAAFEYLAVAMQKQGASIPVFDAVRQVTQRASRIGYGDNDIAAMINAYAEQPVP